MGAQNTRKSRPRCYELPVPAGFASAEIARYVASLDELSERHFDLISGLPAEVLDFLPEGAPSTIAMIAGHLAQGEAFWVSRLTGKAVPSDLAEALTAARTSRPSPCDAGELVRLCHRVRDEVTKPALATLSGSARVEDGQRVITPAGVLMHLVWHWTYHNGQTGLLCMQAGHDFDWTFHPRLVGFVE